MMQKPQIFDILRQKYVALTPEEEVRQSFIHYLIKELHYPQGLLANEVKLQIGSKVLRADSILYNKQLQPIAVMEYKASSVPLTEKVIQQAMAYNTQLHVSYIFLSNGIQHLCYKVDYNNKKLIMLAKIPDYSEL